MIITPRLPSANFGQLPVPRQPSVQTPQGQTERLPDTGRQQAIATAPHFHFVMPDNATTHRGQLALREYQTIQNGGGVELVNRIDERV